MKNYNSYQQYRQTTVPSEASSVKSQVTIQSYLTASPKQRNQLIRSSFKVYQEMKQEIIQNQQCKLSLRFEQIHLLMASQKLFLHLQKMQAFYNKQQKQAAFQLILRLGAIDYSNSSSIFKTPQRSHSPGIVSKDIGMEKNIQNQQLIKIIQELQSQIAGKELCKAIYVIQTKIMRDSLYQIKQQIKLSQKFEKIKSILEVSSKRFALNELREKKNKSKKIEAASLLLVYKLEKFKLNIEFTFFYQLKLSQMKQQLITKQQIQLRLNGYKMGDKNENIKLLRLHQFIIKFCYRFPFNQLKKNQYQFQQIELNQRNSASFQRFSLGQLSQTMSQQVSQVLEASPKNDEQCIEEQEVHQQSVVVQKPKSIQKVNGKLANQIKLYISKCEEQRQQVQQQKLEQMAKQSKKNIQDEIKQKKQNSKPKVQSSLFLAVIFVFVLIFLFRIIN